MRLTFDELDIEGFKSFRERTLIDLQAYGHGLHYMRGRNLLEPQLTENGAGKTTISDALSWCLYGRTPDGLRNPDIIPWEGATTTCVQTQIKIDNKTHFIKRETNPNKLLWDGEATDQTHIDFHLGISFDVFCHTILLAQDSDLFFDLAPKDKLDLFSTVLDLERWDNRSGAANTKAKNLQIKINTLEQGIAALTARQEQIANTIQQTKQLSDTWEQERIAKLDTIDDELTQIRKDLVNIQRKHDEANLAFDGAQTELRPLEKQIRDFQKEQTQLEANYNAGLAIANRDVTHLRNELQALGNATHCPTCGQSLKGTKLATHRAELEKKITALEANIKNKKMPDKVNEIKKKITILNKSQQAFQTKADEAQTQLTLYAPQVGELTAKLRGLEQFQQERRDTVNPYDEQLQALRQQKTKAAKEQRDMETTVAAGERLIQRVLYWVKGFKDVKLFIIEEVLTELELTTNAMLGDVGLIDWSISYDVEKETKTGSVQRGLVVRVQSPRNAKPVRWECWSGGEGQRLRLIGALALGEVLLNYVGVQTTLEILDEPTRSLSKRGVGDLVDFLADRAKRRKSQIFFIDHHVVESAAFATVTTVIRDKKGSRIEYA